MSNYKNIDFLERAFYGISQRVRKGEILRLAVKELEKDYPDWDYIQWDNEMMINFIKKNYPQY